MNWNGSKFQVIIGIILKMKFLRRPCEGEGESWRPEGKPPMKPRVTATSGFRLGGG